MHARLLLSFSALVLALNMPAFADGLSPDAYTRNDLNVERGVAGGRGSGQASLGQYTASDSISGSFDGAADTAEAAPVVTESDNALNNAGEDPTPVASRRRWGIRICMVALCFALFSRVDQRR